MSNVYKVIFVGDGGVGKTSFIKRHRVGEFETRYIPTIGVEVHLIKFHTNNGLITFNIWDISDQSEKFKGLNEECYKKSQAAIVFFDYTNILSYENIEQWRMSIRRVCKDIPIILCGNKIDDNKNVKVEYDQKYIDNKYIASYNVSAKTNYNYYKLYLALAKRFLGIDTYFIVTNKCI